MQPIVWVIYDRRVYYCGDVFPHSGLDRCEEPGGSKLFVGD